VTLCVCLSVCDCVCVCVSVCLCFKGKQLIIIKLGRHVDIQCTAVARHDPGVKRSKVKVKQLSDVLPVWICMLTRQLGFSLVCIIIVVVKIVISITRCCVRGNIVTTFLVLYRVAGVMLRCDTSCLHHQPTDTRLSFTGVKLTSFIRASEVCYLPVS